MMKLLILTFVIAAIQTATSGILSLMQGQPAVAVEQLSAALDVYPNAPALLVFRSAAYWLTHRRELAFADLNRATEVTTAALDRCSAMRLAPSFPGQVEPALAFGVSLHKQPDSGSVVLATLQPGIVFGVRRGWICGFDIAWVEVEYGEQTGWLAVYVSEELHVRPLPVEAMPAATAIAQPVCSATAATEVNLRTGAGTSHALGGTLRPLERVELVARRENDFFTWYQTPGGLWVREDVVSLAGVCDGLPEG
jgi:hypothetical protein